jgi:hypothetical protein
VTAELVVDRGEGLRGHRLVVKGEGLDGHGPGVPDLDVRGVDGAVGRLRDAGEVGLADDGQRAGVGLGGHRAEWYPAAYVPVTKGDRPSA